MLLRPKKAAREVISPHDDSNHDVQENTDDGSMDDGVYKISLTIVF